MYDYAPHAVTKILHSLGPISEPSFCKPCLKRAQATKTVAYNICRVHLSIRWRVSLFCNLKIPHGRENQPRNSSRACAILIIACGTLRPTIKMFFFTRDFWRFLICA